MMRLKEARMATGMTQREVAAKTGIPLGTLRRWEQGVNEPDTESLIMLADLYGVSTDQILGSAFAPDRADTDLTNDERELVENYRASDTAGRRLILDVSRMAKGVPSTMAAGVSA